MRYFFILVSMFVLISCGSKGGGDDEGASTPDPSINQNQYHSRLVETEGALPSCVTEAQGWLIYVKDASVFKTCDDGLWQTVSINGQDGTDGIDGKDGNDATKITGTYNILDKTETNLCTRYSNQYCRFAGGGSVNWSDGSAEFSGSTFFSASYDIGGGETDTDSVHVSRSPFYCSSGNAWCSIMLFNITRTGNDDAHPMWMIYIPSNNEFSIYYDANFNDEFNLADDEKILTLTAESVYIGE